MEAHAEHSHAGGTATRSIAEGFGTLSAAPDTTDIELRASWTPAPRDLGSHLEAWSDMICAFAGLPPEHAADVHTAARAPRPPRGRRRGDGARSRSCPSA